MGSLKGTRNERRKFAKTAGFSHYKIYAVLEKSGTTKFLKKN